MNFLPTSLQEIELGLLNIESIQFNIFTHLEILSIHKGKHLTGEQFNEIPEILK